MGDKNFKQIGKFQFSVDIPMDSDLMVAIKLGTEKRDNTLQDLCEFMKSATRDDKEKILEKIDGVVKMNESIKLMEDAAVAVRMYKLEQKNNSVE